MAIIGFSARARGGKDTAGQYLHDNYGWQVHHFAGLLKEGIGRQILGLNDEQLYGNLKETIDDFWGMSPRELLQKAGTDAMRANVHQDIWVKALERAYCNRPGGENWVVCDVRFPNEGTLIKQWGGKMIRLIGQPQEQIAHSTHASETSMDNWTHFDYTIMNTGSIPEFHIKLDNLMNLIS